MEHRAQLHDVEAAAHSGASPQQLDEALADGQAWVVGDWQEAALEGYALVAKLPFDAELQAIGVLPARQGQGIGQRLLNEAVAVAKRWQAERLLLEVRAGNQRAIALYRQAGFEEDGCRKGYYPAANGATGREDALLMSLKLD
ncbi:ribosomal protein S18-alanine N-acetyltransferase [Vreelandella aquamarina]|uniref:ribosomal protein S18-alanine N-acetyltransferase n=1 Tax=Vreelandella aquamarina TaxID=77097 RepID=UPI00384B52BD